MQITKLQRALDATRSWARRRAHALALPAALALGAPAVAQAAPTIAQIQANPAAFFDQIVTITGTVTLLIDQNEFALSDGTGQIKVDAGPPWYKVISVPLNQQVTVTGQIDFGGRVPSVDLDACRIVGGFGTIDVRDCGFNTPPPWAGGPNRGERGGPPPWAGGPRR